MQSASLPKPTANAAAKNTSTPLVKPNSQSYAEAYSFIVGQYQRHFYITLYLFSAFFAILFQLGFFFNYHTFLNVFSWKTVLFSLLLFAVGFAISLIRMIKATAWEPAYASKIIEFLSVATSMDSVTIFVVHAVASLIVIRTYLSWVMGEKYTSGFLLHPPGHYSGARQLNEENIFICVYAIILAFNYTVNFLSKRSFVVQVLNVQQPLYYDIKTSIATVLCNSAKRALYSFRNTYITYLVCNITIYYYVAHFFGIFTKVLDAPIDRFHWIDLHLFLRLIVAGILTTCIFNITNRLYDAFFSYTLPCTDPYANQFECLIKGLEEKEKDCIKVAAFSELATLSSKRPDKRQQLFNSVGNELHENAWYKIMVQCFNVINEFRTKIDIEYNGVRQVATPVPVTKPVEKSIRNRLEFSNGTVFTTPKKNQVYYDDRTSSFLSSQSELAEHTPLSQPESLIAKPLKWLCQNDMVDMLKSLELKFGHAGMFEPFYAETVTGRVQTVFNKYQLLVWAVQSLGCLTAGSLKEDPYGYVQNDIGNVLNHLLGCLVDIEKYVQSPPAQYKKLLNENVVSGETQAVMMALREAIYQISEAFGQYTDGFQVDSKYLKKWQGFLNYQE